VAAGSASTFIFARLAQFQRPFVDIAALQAEALGELGGNFLQWPLVAGCEDGRVHRVRVSGFRALARPDKNDDLAAGRTGLGIVCGKFRQRTAA
jgi:hypothetical protein